MYLNYICSSLSPDTYGDPDVISKKKEGWGLGGRWGEEERQGKTERDKDWINLSTWQ